MEDENENKDIDLEISMFDFLKGKEEQEDNKDPEEGKE